MEYVAPLNEIVNLLDKHGGRILSRLRERLPSEHGRLTIGLTLGGDEASTKIDAEICLAGLQIAIRVCRTGAHHLRRRLKITNGFGLAGQLLTATAGASIFGVVAADAPKATQYGVGIVALFGA